MRILKTIAIITCLCSQWTQAQECAQTSYSYDHADGFVDGLARVQRDGKWGFIDKNGTEVIPCKWDDIYYFIDGLALVERDGKYGFINTNSEIVVPCIYDSAIDFCEGKGVAAICKYTENGNGNWAVIDNQGNVLTPFKFHEVVRDGFGNTWVFCDEENDEGMLSEVSYIIDKNGNKVDDPNENGSDENLTRVYKTTYRDGKFGIVTDSGDEIVPCAYESVLLYSEGFAAVKIDNKWGYVNENGEQVIPCIFDDVRPFKDGCAIVTQNSKKGFIDTKGEFLLPCIYDEADYFMDGLANVNNESFINLKGEIVLTYKNDIMTETIETIPDWYHRYAHVRYYDGCAQVMNNEGKWGLVDKLGREIVRPRYGVMQEFSEGLAVVKIRIGDILDGKYKCGYINTKGEEIVPLKYDDASNFSCGLGRVAISGTKFFIDNKGNRQLSLKTKYEQIGKSFEHGLLPVKKNDKWGYVNRHGEEIISPKYEAIQYFSEGFAAVKYLGKWGFIKKEKLLINASLVGELRIKRGDKMAMISDDKSQNYIQKASNNIEESNEIRVVEIISPKYDWVSPFINGFARVAKDNMMGVINATGKQIVPIKYYDIKDNSDGLFAVKSRAYTWGFIDENGNTSIPCGLGVAHGVDDTDFFGNIESLEYEYVSEDYDYDFIGQFHDGRALVMKHNKYGYIDKKGNLVIPIKYNIASKFRNGTALVSMSDIAHAVYIDTNGKISEGKIMKQNPFLTRPQHESDWIDVAADEYSRNWFMH